jgi:hypothetical protein
VAKKFDFFPKKGPNYVVKQSQLSGLWPRDKERMNLKDEFFKEVFGNFFQKSIGDLLPKMLSELLKKSTTTQEPYIQLKGRRF